MTVKSILVADDERHLRSALFTALTRLGHAVELAENGQEALTKFTCQRFDVVISDLRMPQMDGLTLLKEIKKISPMTPVVIITAHGTVESAVEAMREGAQDFILKPFPSGVIEEAVNRAFSQTAEAGPKPAAAEVKPNDKAERPLVTQSPKMQKILSLAKTVAQSPATVLLQGESGTGKELMARFIHNNSPRREGPFVAVNCASLPENLLESELFGHEKGAFTGAVARKQGKFELADGGTILLDEISEMDISLQAKLLRVLQEGEIDRVGGKEPQKIDVRVIATTNRNLKQWADEGKFRADLYYRLNVIPFYLPALKERADDIPCLAEHFRKKYSAQNNKEVDGLSENAIKALMSFNWPGNIRELENTVARGVLLAGGRLIEAHDLFMDESGFMAALERTTDFAETKPAQLDSTKTVEAGESEVDFGDIKDYDDNDFTLGTAYSGGALMTIGEMEKQLIGQALNETAGNRTHAAKILGISVRTLRNKLAEYRATI